jgi:LmbE family N-acetylglucosaminyl deacetylase
MSAKSCIAIAAHPDDIEFLMSGTLLLLRKAGYEIHYWNLANGCCGSTQYSATETARIRREEAASAAKAIGAMFHESICNDLEIYYDAPTLRKVAAVIREVTPEIVLTHSPVDYMEDHTNTCRLAVTAAFSRGMPNFVTDPPRPAVNNPVTVYHAQPYSHRDPLGNVIEPTIVVDTTDLIDRKQKMLAKHVSQKQWLDESQGVNSYLDKLAALDAEVGKMSGIFKHAEGWRKHLHMGFCGEADDPLTAALKGRALVAAR